jgi:hypothetical protein
LEWGNTFLERDFLISCCWTFKQHLNMAASRGKRRFTASEVATILQDSDSDASELSENDADDDFVQTDCSASTSSDSSASDVSVSDADSDAANDCGEFTKNMD